MKRKFCLLLAATVCISMLSGCGADRGAEENMENSAAEETEAPDAQEETKEAPPLEMEKAEPIETEEAEEEVPVYEEDKNIYGNTIGNFNNEGTFIYNEEDGCIYFQNIYNKHMVKTDPKTGDTVNLTDKPMLLLNLYDGKLYGVETTDEQARAVAQSIADSIPAGSDLERVRAAAAAVAGYCSRGTYTSEESDYNTAYGVFCKGVNTCAGATRALGLVLDCMGYSWKHVNPNQWTHQWCELTMDGQKGWADGMGGLADYGEFPFLNGGSYTTPDGTTYYLAQ